MRDQNFCTEEAKEEFICNSFTSLLPPSLSLGPDGFSACDYNLPQDLDASPRTQVKLVNSVLCLRGAGLTEQPFRSSDGRFYLSWNGQVFHWNLPETKQEDQSWKVSDFNDGKFLFDVLMKRISKSDADEEKIGEIFSQVLSQIEGPYATVLLDVSCYYLRYQSVSSHTFYADFLLLSTSFKHARFSSPEIQLEEGHSWSSGLRLNIQVYY